MRLKLAAGRLKGPVLLFILLVLAFWRILLTDQYSWLNSPDLSNQVLPWFQFQAGEWHAGRIPFWSPYEWAGQNLLGQGQPGVMNPLNWLLFAAPLRRGWIREGALNWWFFFLHYVGALNLYYLARSLGSTRLPSILGALVFALLGFLGSNDWPQMISGIVWAPLVFLFLLKSGRGEEPLPSAAWSGFFLGLAWLSGHHQLPIFLSLAAAAAAITLRCYPAILTFAVAGMVGAVQLLPGLAYGRISRRWVGLEDPIGWQEKVPFFIHEQYANPPVSLFGILLPGLDYPTSLFLGATALGLALVAIRYSWTRPDVRLFTGLGVAAIFYAFSRNGLLESIAYSFIPMVEKARSPSMAAAIFTFSFATLAALGLTQVASVLHSKLLPRLHWIFAGIVFTLFTLGLLSPRNQQQLEDRWMAVAFVSLLIGFAYRAWQNQQLTSRTLAILLIAAVMIESANLTYYHMANRFDKNLANLLTPMSRHANLRDFLSSRPGPVRITVDDQAIPYNFGDWHGVEVMGGYLASLSENLSGGDWFTEPSMQLLGIGYHVGPTPRKEGSTMLLQGDHGIAVWRYPRSPFPRVWLSHSTFAYRDKNDFGNLLSNESLDFRKVTLVQDPAPKLESCEAGDAIVLKHNPGEVVLRANANCRGLLIVSETDDAGWSVAVDGQPAKKLTVFHALRAVELSKGAHSVIWTYSPPGFRLGLLLTLLGCLIPLGFTLWPQLALRPSLRRNAPMSHR